VDRSLYLLIGCALSVQAFVHYAGQTLPSLRAGSFFYATALARTLVPWICVAVLLRVPIAELGLGRPRIPKRELGWLAGLLLVGTGVALLVLQLESYQAAYSPLRTGDFAYRLRSWALFTASTTLPWELFHRGFLLHGLRALCVRNQIPREHATHLAILVTACFEVIFHFSKPPEETLGMLVGSPALSALAFRYGSLWVPCAIHLWVEFLWFVMVWL